VTDYGQEYVDRGDDRLGLHVYPDMAGGPVIVVFPAMGVPARYYRHFAAALSEAGLWPVVAELRGTGTSTPRPGPASRYGYRELAGDVGAVLDALKERRAGRRTLLLGHSLGGQACALHLAGASGAAAESEAAQAAGAARASEVDGLVLVAVGLPYWRCYQGRRVAWLLALTQGIRATSALLRVWPGWSFGGRQSRGVIRDWAYTARHGRFPMPGAERGLGQVTTPVLAVTVEHDQYTPPATTEALLAKLSAAPVTRARYTTEDAGAPLDHFRWTRAAAPLARRIADFAGRLP
jgi:predicted alpha/beta hydrolase